MDHPDERRRTARAIVRLALLAGTILAAACGPAGTGREVASAVGENSGVVSGADADAIRTGYLERARLGLGSPFRLIDYALADPRLDDATGREIAGELFDAAARGEPYEVDAAVLLPSWRVPTAGQLSWAQRHVGLIDGAVSGASDPRAGERAVRVAYRLALLESTVDERTDGEALRLAAVIRDRRLAMLDARRLLAAARAAGAEPIDLVPLWRRENRLLVELPTSRPLPASLEQGALALAPRLLQSIRLIALEGSAAPDPRVVNGARAADLRRLRAVADSMDMPPRAAIVTAMLRTGLTLPAGLRGRWESFTASAADEERFAARYAEAAGGDPMLRTALARAALRAAVGMRTDAQEPVWYPGTPSPDAGQLQLRYGVRVRADREVPERWIPFVLTRLDESLARLQEIVPTVDLRGLRIAITRESRIPGALASHSPGPRELDWPVGTAAGTLAHEIGHDLDWQARRRAAPRAHDYASDRVIRGGQGNFAAALAILTPEATGAPVGISPPTRPTEVVARTFDWFISSRLAARNQSAGALATGQDDLLGGVGEAVVGVLRPLVVIPAGERAAFLAEHGRSGAPRSDALLESLSARLRPLAPSPKATPAPGATEVLGAIAAARDSALAGLSQSTCQAVLLSPDAFAGYRRLVNDAALARSRGAAIQIATTTAGEPGRAWMTRELYGPLWPAATPDSAALPALQSVLAEARALEGAEPVFFRRDFDAPATAAPPCPTPALPLGALRVR